MERYVSMQKLKTLTRMFILLEDEYAVLISTNLFGVTVKYWLIYSFLLELLVNLKKIFCQIRYYKVLMINVLLKSHREK